MVQAFEHSDDPYPISRAQARTPAPAGIPRVPPHNLDAEESLLGAMLLSRDAIAVAIELLGPEDFYKQAHAHLFSAITSLTAEGKAADAVTVAEELRRRGLLEAIGDQSIFIQLQANTPTIGNAEHYARIIEEHSLLRRLIAVAGEINELGYSLPEDVSAVLDRAESLVFDVAERRVTDSVTRIRDALGATLDRIEMLSESANDITGLETGYSDLDRHLSGLHPSNLVIVGARPSVGKTSFALGMVAHAGVKMDQPVLLFSLEMNNIELMQRMLCSEALVDSTRMRTGKWLESDWPKISNAISVLNDAPIFIDDNPNLTVMDIRARARRIKSQHGLGLIVIDYLQLMTGRRNVENRQVEVSEISRGLKILARELEVPVVALSQLSRGLEARQDKRPMLSDLRESGSIEQDADVVLFLYRDEVYNPESSEGGKAEVIVAKNRNGPTGTIELAFRSQFTRFADMARRGPGM